MPKARPTRRIYIPKANGKKRPLGIPTVRDRVAQNIMKNVLEPEWEAIFEANSYGFRPGRSCQDAIQQSYARLCAKKGHDTWVLDADIEGFFDNIEHESILAATRYNSLIEGWLKAGLVSRQGAKAPRETVSKSPGIEKVVRPSRTLRLCEVESKKGYNPTEIGTPQGGVISPIFANRGLHGLETYIRKLNPKVGVVRYADDFIVTGKNRESLELLKVQINQWLSERGLRISEEKTPIVHIKEGFNFLGFNLRQYEIREKGVLKTKLLIKPQQSKILE